MELKQRGLKFATEKKNKIDIDKKNLPKVTK